MNKSSKWQPCPRCESNKVENRGGCFYFSLGFCLLGVSIWLLIIPPIGIAGIVLGLALMGLSIFAKGMLQCQDCKNTWKYDPDINKNKN